MRHYDETFFAEVAPGEVPKEGADAVSKGELVTHAATNAPASQAGPQEHAVAIDGAAGLCEALLTGTKNVRLLATGREALRISGEWIHRLAPLPTPPLNETMTAAEAMTFPVLQLFVERAMANLDTFELRDENAPSVANICHRLDGVPLAIEFAAARVDLLDVHTIAKGLDDRFALLTNGHRNALPRHQTLR